MALLSYSTLGVIYGAGYTADHVTRIALWIMVGISAAACPSKEASLPVEPTPPKSALFLIT
jgi:hypothetical protein